MFHVEQSLMAAASLVWVVAAAEPCNPVVLAGESEQAALECNLGLQDTLMGYRESATRHFRQALEADESCALAQCGLILLERDTDNYRERLESLQSQLANYTPTPAEAFFLNTLLKLACNEVNGAAEDFRNQAEHHRNDIAATCWAVSLLHLAGKADEAVQLADAALQAHPSEVMLLYLRAAVEETGEEVSDRALHCAQAAAILLHDSAQAELLYGKLLLKRGYHTQSCAHFHEARRLARQDMKSMDETGSYTYLAAGLGEATALLSAGRTKEALALRRAMNAEKLPAYSAEAAILHQWEVLTLPLRSLILEPSVTTSGVKAAVQAAGKHDALYREYVQCLDNVLQARCTNNKFEAEALIATAKLHLKHLVDAPRQQDLNAVVLQRAKYACAMAIAAAQTHLYRDTDNTWFASIEPLPDALGRYLPPVVPPHTIVPRGTK